MTRILRRRRVEHVRKRLSVETGSSYTIPFPDSVLHWIIVYSTVMIPAHLPCPYRKKLRT